MRILLVAVRCEAISRRFGRGLPTCVERGLRPDKANVLGYASGEDKQILRQEGEPPREIEGIQRRADRRGEADRFKFVRANPSCHGSGFEDLENAHGAEMQTPSRSRGCPGRRRSISPARSTTPVGLARSASGSSRTALYESAHIILTKPLKGCSQITTEEIGDWIVKRTGMCKANFWLACRLAVIMHQTLTEGAPFNAAAV